VGAAKYGEYSQRDKNEKNKAETSSDPRLKGVDQNVLLNNYFS
jgi:hypothetical protein